MKPKRRILLVDDRHFRLGITRFVLRVHGYHVDSVEAVKTQTLSLRGYDLLLICGDLNVTWSKGYPRTPTVWYAQRELRDVPCGVRVAEVEGIGTLVEVIRIAMARKRGPKPQRRAA